MQRQHSLSQEITVKSDSQRKYRWVLGAFGFYDHRVIDTPVAIKEEGIAAMQAHLDAFTANAPLTISYANDRIDLPGVYTKPSRGAAFFHQSTVNDLFGVTGLSGTAGIRFDYEHTGLDFSTESEGGDVNLLFNIPNRPMPPMFIEGDTLLTGSYSKDFWKILPKFALQYQFTRTAHVYLSASKGYKTGGYNEQAFSKILQGALAASIMEGIAAKMPPNMPMPGGAPNGDGTKPTLEEQLSYDPETSWTYELGGRYEMFENRLSLNYALFYSRVNNIQIIKLEDQGTSGRTVKNAGKSESKGFELSLKYVPLQNLSLYADYGFADARFVDYEAAEDVDYSGNHIPFAPRHTVSLGTSYVHNFANGSLIDRLSGNIQYAGVGKIYWTESNKTTPQDGGEGVELYQPFYGLVNGSISAERGAFSLELWAKNLFNTDYHSFLFEASDMTTGKVNQFVQRGYPTRFGATLRYTIGR
jgi:outer membrane receptor protein involved in Fe transport